MPAANSLCIEVLVEGPSAEEALKHLLPKLLKDRSRYKIINFGSKSKLINFAEHITYIRNLSQS